MSLRSSRPERLSQPSNAFRRQRRRLNLKLDSRIESAMRAESMMLEFSRKAGCAERQCEEIGLAVREAVVNAVCHGNHYDLNKKVELTAEINEPDLVVCVND